MIKANTVDLQEARVMMDAMLEYASVTEPGLPMAMAIVDLSGVLVAFARMDGAATGPRIMAENKAFTTIQCKGLGTSEDVGKFISRDFVFDLGTFVQTGRICPVEGGFPIKDKEGNIIGGIAASGREGFEDARVVQAGLKALEKLHSES